MIIVLSIVLLIAGIAGTVFFFTEEQPIPGTMGLLLILSCLGILSSGTTNYKQKDLLNFSEKVTKACEKNGGLEKLKTFSGEIQGIKCKNGAKFNSKAVENL